MVQGIVDIVKLFLEKYFIPSIIAIVAVFFTYLAIPPESWLLQKLGEDKFFVFAFCLYFLIIICIMFSVTKIRKFYISYKNENYYRNRKQEENKEAWNDALENIWSVVDDMSPKDYKLLLEFVTNGNQPHVTAGRVGGGGLLNSEWVHKALHQPSQEVIVYQYKLKNNIYKLLKYSLDNYGGISHFDQ